MEFKEKLNLIFEIIGCSNAEIAKVSGIDPSLVSRYRAGIRQPKSVSTQFPDLCNGIASYARSNGLWDKLQCVCQLPDTSTPEEALLNFLLPDTLSQTSKRRTSSVNSNKTFGSKLRLLMKLLDISNIKLAKALNVDPSLISRLKNGQRVPKENNALIESLCDYLHRSLKSKGLTAEMAKWLELPADIAEAGNEDFIQCFSKWLLIPNEVSADIAIKDFMQKFEILVEHPIYTSKAVLDAPVPPSLMYGNTPCKFYGYEGFKDAITALFAEVVNSKQRSMIKFYSDQNLDWFQAARSQQDSLAHLLYQVLLKQTKIELIHNIDQNLAELLIIGIEMWLPLYMSNLIDVFFSPAPSSDRFSHTLVVAPGIATIYSTHVRGMESEGIYYLSTSEEDILFSDHQFEALIKNSIPLIKVFSQKSINDYYFFKNEKSKEQGTTKKLIMSPGINTMPPHLLERILQRSQTHELDSNMISKLYTIINKLFEYELTHRAIVEYIYFPEPEILASGQVTVNLSDMLISETFTYSIKEYSEHIKHLITLLEHKNYHIVPLSSIPFNNIQIIAKEPGMAVIKYCSTMSFCFNQSLLCSTFSKYIDDVTLKIKLPLNTKRDIVNFLKKYVQ